MPELPEVEALVRFLDERCRDAVVEGCQLASISALKSFDPPLESLAGRPVEGWQRRGKYLQMRTGPSDAAAPAAAAGSQPALWLVLHLARGGWVSWWDQPPRGAVRLGGRGPLALRVALQGGRGFDVTEMGSEKRLAVWVVRHPSEVQAVAELGPEPLDPSFDRAALAGLLAGEKGTLKNALSRQSLVAGIGNAYSDEILHAARLSPFKPAGGLSDEETDRLYGAVRQVLDRAVERAVGMRADELKGEKKLAMAVHGRTGQPCPVCGDVVREVSFATRSLQYCPTCQTGGKPLADRRLSRLVK
ncbi:MAG TPA: DNA-formamidopyrimidine glycosylase family protein [Acidimicrobiales bacterium]|nr:DNA-formamidopyrimidine glycosylase family protein [Acidimicrobiales bacterium]